MKSFHLSEWGPYSLKEALRSFLKLSHISTYAKMQSPSLLEVMLQHSERYSDLE